MDKKKPNRIVIRVTNDVQDKIIEIAEKENATQSSVVRYLIEKGIETYDMDNSKGN